MIDASEFDTRRMHACLAFVNDVLLLPLFTVLVVEAFTGADDYAWLNNLMCLTFACEWVLGLLVASDRRAYLRSPEKIADAVSSLPFSALSSARVFRLLRLLRFVRLVARVRRYAVALTSLARAAVMVGAVVLSSAIVMQAIEPGRMSLEQAVWWSIVTMSTVGYGDFTPSTPAGHAVASLVILAGVGVFGYLAGLSAALLSSPRNEPQ